MVGTVLAGTPQGHGVWHKKWRDGSRKLKDLKHESKIFALCVVGYDGGQNRLSKIWDK